jgi:hypothetical protein
MNAQVKEIVEELIKKTDEELVDWKKTSGEEYSTILYSGKAVISKFFSNTHFNIRIYSKEGDCVYNQSENSCGTGEVTDGYFLLKRLYLTAKVGKDESSAPILDDILAEVKSLPEKTIEKTPERLDIGQFNPCKNGLEYYESKASFKEAWNDCKNGSWMLWMAKKLEIDAQILSRARILCDYIPSSTPSFIESALEKFADTCRGVLTDAVLEKVKQLESQS